MSADGAPTTSAAATGRLLRLLDGAAERIQALERARNEPIAVVGLGCRFPGGADDPEAYWRLLRDGVDATAEIPAERWDVPAFFDPDPQAAGRMYVRRGGFLTGVDRFDARFFEIAPREAAGMDPQQRLLLEVAWEALEHAGLPAERLAGTSAGVFVGLTTSDYGQLLLREGAASLDAYFSTGNALNGAAGRIAHALGLQGPSMAVDSACSSSLVAVHLACQSLRTGDADLALAGGVNLILAPDNSIAISRARMLSPDGRCKTFDAGADGYARAEGCGVVVLKRASDALAAGDRILALIRGSAVNHDGASGGFTVPNPRAQEALIRRALRNAQVEPAQIDYLEAHGTGTSLGDPIEVQAAAAALGAGRDPQRPLLLGSVKTNFGHAESAAGIAGLIKTVLALHHGEIPPHLHFHTPNPHIPWDALPVRVVTQCRPWPQAGGPRHAGVSAFGASGTNAHVVLQAAPAAAPAQAAAATPPERTQHVLALSARSREALAALALRHAERLEAVPPPSWADHCFSTNTGRAQLPLRAAVVAGSAAEAAARLRTLAATPVARAAGAARTPRVAFLFPGQGAQYEGMGRALYAAEPVFRGVVDRCDEVLRGLLPLPLVRALHGEAPGALDDTLLTQPALFAIGLALAETWRAWGVQPAAVMGHSVGEYVAACVAGVFDLEDGLKLLARRAALMSALPAGGAMAAISASAEAVAARLAPYAGEASIAAVNAPQQTVVSGSARAVAALVEAFTAAGIPAQPLRVSHAFHSPLMEPMLAEFEWAARQVRYRAPRLPVISNLSGAPAGPEITSADYWVRHVRQPVLFAAGARALAALGCDAYVEAGPGRTLLELVRRNAPEAGDGEPQPLSLPGLRRGSDEWASLFDGLGRLYERGQNVDWEALDRGRGRTRLALPTYPWQRQRHWRPAPVTGAPASAASPVEAAVPAGEVQDAAAGLCYALEWRASPVAAPWAGEAPRALADALQPRLPEVAAQHADAAYLQALAQLEEVSLGYAAQAWRALGWRFEPGWRCREDALAATLGVVPAHVRLLHHSARMLQDGGLLRRVGEGAEAAWESTGALPPTAADAALERVRTACPGAEAETTLLGRCGPGLAAVMAGRQDPLALLFPAGDTSAASRLYGDAPGVRIMNRMAAEAVAQALQRLPAGRPLRVLEIGAGTGGTTSALLELLPAQRTSYVYTDVSPRFLTAARERFSRYGFIRYELLDIERDPAGQGFADEPPFDLVVAANVLHATRDLAQALRHARQLAAPGALLLLIEGTAPIRTIDLIFGLTEGWWHFTDTAQRPDYPLISPEAWSALLQRCGFGGMAALAMPPSPWGVLARQALMLARADEVPAAGATLPQWLLLADCQGVAERLAARHTARGGACACLLPGDDAARALAALDPAMPLEVLDLRALDAPAPQADAAQAAHAVCAGALELVRALVDAARPLRRLCFVTRGATGEAAPAPASSAPVQAALWGLARVAGAEHPELKVTRVDLDAASDPDTDAGQLWTELALPAREDELRWRHGERQIARLARRAEPAPGVAVTFRADASYLITGGLGALGLLTARWMADRGARTLVLAGRSAPGEQAQQTLDALRAAGVRVVVQQADVARAEDVARLLDHVATQLPPLRGVVHAAGVLEDGTLRQLDAARFARVLGPKVAGAWHLHRLTAGLELDCFVIYSSFTSLLGTPGQATHAAACASLDAIAAHRRALGLPALSIGWGAWADIGAAARQDVRERLDAHGGGAITPAQGLQALERVWRAQDAYRAVVAMDWVRLAANGLRRPLLAELAPLARGAAAAATAPEADWPARLQGASPARRRALLGDLIRTETARVLGLSGAGAIEPGQGFFELGMDSLTSLELRNRIGAALRCTLPATVAFDHPNAEALAAFVQRALAPDPAPEAQPASMPVDDALADLAALSADDIDRLIDELDPSAR